MADPRRSRQHHKGKKRDGGWHQGREAGRANDRVFTGEVEPAFARAATDRADGAALAALTRDELRDHRRLLDGLRRVCPCAGLRVPDPLL